MSLTNNTLKKFSWYKQIFLWLGGLLTLLIGGIIALPAILSSKAGTKWLCKELYRQKGIELEVDNLSLHWFGPQVATQIRGGIVKKKLTFSGERIESSASLWELLTQNQLQQMVIQSPHIDIETPLIPPSVWIYRKPPTHKAGMLSEWQVTASSLQTPWKGSLQIKEGSLICKDPALEPIVFDKIQCDLEMKEGLVGSLNARTLQGKESGSLNLRASLQPSNDCQVQLSLQNLPTKGLDQCASLFFPEYQGLLPSLIGSSLNVEAQLLSEGELINLHFDLLSSLSQIHIDGKSSSSLFSLTKPAEITFELSPRLLSLLSPKIPSFKALTLTNPVSLQITIPSLQVPLPLQGWQQAGISCEASLKSPLTGTWEGIPFHSSLLSLKLDSQEIQNKLVGSFNALLQLGSTQGSLNALCNLSSPFSSQRTGSLQCSSTQFPLHLLSAWGINAPLFFGDTADMSLSLQLEGSHPEIRFSWQSSKLQIPNTAISLTPAGWQLIAPLTFAYDLDVKLLPPSPLTLSQITPIQGTIQTFAFSKDQIDQLILHADITCKEALIAGAVSEKISNFKAILDVQSCQKVSLKATSDILSGSIAGSFNPYEKTFRASTPLSLEYTLSKTQIPSLIEPSLLQITVEPFSLSLDSFSTALKGQVFIPKLGIKTDHIPLYLQDSTSTFQWNAPSQRLDVQLVSQISSTVPGTIQGKLSFFPAETGKKLQNNNLAADGSLQLRSVSSELLSLLFQTPTLRSFVGEAINADFDFATFPQESNIQINWTSPLLKFQTAWAINQEGWALTMPTTIDWIWSTGHSESFPVQLQEDLPITLSLSKCTIPSKPASSQNSFFDRFHSPIWNWETLECTSNLNFSHLKAIDIASHDGLEIASCNVDFYKPPSNAPMNLKLDALLYSMQPSGKKEGSIVLGLQIAPDLKTKNLNQSLIQLKLDAKQFPTVLLDLTHKIVNRSPSNFSSLLGKSLYCSCDASFKELSGPLHCELNTPTTRLFLDGQLLQGALVLDAPLQAQFSLTEKSSQAILSSVNPLNLSAIYSQNPVTLTLFPERFHLPLFPWKPELCNIPKGSLELGKIRCKNEGNVGIALNLLKSPSSNGNQLNLWFAPLDFSIQNGVASIERTEVLLSDAFDVCLFGNLDLTNQNVDMTLGLTAQALNRAFGIKGLPKEYVLTIPMKGKLDDVQINSGKATAKVGLLLAWQNKMLQGAVKGPAGALANELLGAVATLPDANAKIPPAKHPFPWEQAQEERPAKQSKKKTFKTSDKPLKQIMKVYRK